MVTQFALIELHNFLSVCFYLFIIKLTLFNKTNKIAKTASYIVCTQAQAEKYLNFKKELKSKIQN